MTDRVCLQVYGAEGEVAELATGPAGRLMYNYRVDGVMTPHCPDDDHWCNTTGADYAIACGTPTDKDAASPHHCRASMISDSGGITWTNAAKTSSIFGDGIADLRKFTSNLPLFVICGVFSDGLRAISADVGQKGGFASGKGGLLVMSNAPDNRDPGEEQQPRFNLTASLSSDGGLTFPHKSIIFPAHSKHIISINTPRNLDWPTQAIAVACEVMYRHSFLIEFL